MPAYCVYELIRPTILYLAAPRYGENSVNTLFVHVISVSGESETISHIFWINEQGRKCGQRKNNPAASAAAEGRARRAFCHESGAVRKKRNYEGRRSLLCPRIIAMVTFTLIMTDWQLRIAGRRAGASLMNGKTNILYLPAKKFSS